ncbi:MAG: C40 family peptidase [Spirochaetes bacterium]|nr:C40 family peptidase [Spirochaetota bacterium]
MIRLISLFFISQSQHYGCSVQASLAHERARRLASIVLCCIILATVALLSFAFVSCAILPTPDDPRKRQANRNSAERNQEPNTAFHRRSPREVEEIRAKLIAAAEHFRGADRLVVRGRRFNMDCSGLVSAIYYYAGIDLQRHFPYHTGTGTERIYKTLRERQLIKRTWYPLPGDLIFWDNTFDRNRNGRDDDLLTHVGMVVSVDRRGNIVYVHHNFRRGVVFEHMNIRKRNVHTQVVNGETVIVNSPMRIRGENRGNRPWLAGQLVNSFGEAYHLD